MSLKARVAKLEARHPKGVLAFLNMLEPRYHGMTKEQAIKAAGYDRLGPHDCLYVFWPGERLPERRSVPEA